MTRVLYTYPARFLDRDPAPIVLRDKALAEHPEVAALVDLLNRELIFEAEAWRDITQRQATEDRLRAEIADLKREVGRLQAEFDEGVETYLEAQAEMLWERGRAA